METIDEAAAKWTPSAGYMKRAIACVLDFYILWIVGIMLSYPFSGAFIEMGWKGKGIGFAITLLYFSLFDSFLFKGQTPGQKLFKIKVVGANGKYLTLARSAARSLVFPLLITLNNWKLPLYPDSLAFPIMSFILFSLLLTEVYFAVFGRTSKRLLHDVIAGTYVLDANTNTANPRFRESGKNVLRFSFAPAVFSLFLCIVLFGVLNSQPVVKQTLAIQSDLRNVLEAPGIGVSYGRDINVDGDGADKTSSNLRLTVNGRLQDGIPLEKDILAVLKKHSLPGEVDTIEFRFITGFDIGIAAKSGYETKKYSHEEYIDAIR